MRRLLLAVVFAQVGCTTGASLRLEAETIQSQLNGAREAGAYRCAPRELAIAEANLEFLQNELDQGNSVRASEHKVASRRALVTVLERAKGCMPEPIEVAAVADRDGDGVLDENDECPDDAGPEALLGCPDRDGDGIADRLDKCPDTPEDMDGNEDEDGCPEAEDRDGDGLLDGDDACPDVPGPRENKGCPMGDADQDGILDDVDVCPRVAEDRDGFEDEDGCPDPDNDGDGILDEKDNCPLQPETKNGFEDEDGCPDVKLELVKVNRELGKIEISQTVYFETGKATIRSRSFPLLNEVAQALAANDTMEVLVEGHTDSVGSNSMNLDLSDRRAQSVRDYLTAQGIEGGRLTALGFGEERPIDTNRTKSGREKNRRVEFTITKQ